MRALFPVLISIALPLTAASSAAADGFELKRVLLSTGGVGYFEHEAQVEGAAILALSVRRDQVDDVLKSVVVYDDGGGVGTISLPGEEPLEAVFRELPFSRDALASPAALLNALKGAEVRASGTQELSGRLLSVNEETQPLPDNRGTITRNRVALMTDAGISQFLLEDAASLRFADSALEAQVDRALKAIAALSNTERRTLTIRTTGEGKRTVRVGYVVAAPLWKATYRLTLPQTGTGNGDLQGWAVLENLSGLDWANVDLTVVSGNPVTFRQNLYAASFVERPLIPVEVMGRVLPKLDERTTPVDEAMKSRMADVAGAPPAVAMPAPMAAAPMRERAAGAAPKPAAPIAAESAEATTQVVFRYPMPVSLANGGSLLMPIVARAVPSERLALYQPATQPRYPLASVRLTNDGGSGLPPGVLTLYERSPPSGTVSFVGDARLAALPAGEKRLLSFAVDQKVAVDRAEKPDRLLSQAAIVDGTLTLTVTERQATTYTIVGAPQEDRTVVIEHPRRSGWSLIEPAGEVDATSDSLRLPVAVPAGKTIKFTAMMEKPRLEKLIVADLPLDRIQIYAAADDLPAAVREAFAKLAKLRAEVADADHRLRDLNDERNSVTQDQERLRQNLGTLPRDSDLYKRTLNRMTDAETRLERLAADIATARKDVDKSQAAVTAFIRGLKT